MGRGQGRRALSSRKAEAREASTAGSIPKVPYLPHSGAIELALDQLSCRAFMIAAAMYFFVLPFGSIRVLTGMSSVFLHELSASGARTD